MGLRKDPSRRSSGEFHLETLAGSGACDHGRKRQRQCEWGGCGPSEFTRPFSALISIKTRGELEILLSLAAEGTGVWREEVSLLFLQTKVAKPERTPADGTTTAVSSDTEGTGQGQRNEPVETPEHVLLHRQVTWTHSVRAGLGVGGRVVALAKAGRWGLGQAAASLPSWVATWSGGARISTLLSAIRTPDSLRSVCCFKNESH